MCEAVFWEKWTEWTWGAFPYCAYDFFPFFWLLNWNNSNKYQTRKFSFSNLIIFKAFLECIKFYFSNIKHLLLH